MTTMQKWTIADIKAAMNAAGSHWFDRDTMRFFKTRIHPYVYQGEGGIYFVTSETNPSGITACSVRQFKPEGPDIKTAGEFHAYSKDNAISKAKLFAQKGNDNE